MRKLTVLLALSFVLAACGVKGDPVAPGTAPTPEQPQPQQPQ